MKRAIARVVVGIGGLALFVATGAQAQRRSQPLAIPLARTPVDLGAGYDSQAGEPRADLGACVIGEAAERQPGGGARYSIATLMRAGGRLVVGIHVSAPVFVEVLPGARVTDAARRLWNADPEAFRDLCGDGYVATRTIGDHFLAEIEVERKDVLRARTHLQVGTWTEPAAFQKALEGLVKHNQVTARELPGGSRAAARAIPVDELLSRALAFPASVAPENAKPYLAAFQPYHGAAFSGMPLPAPDELDDEVVAEALFRDRNEPSQSAAVRAAEMRAAQVQRSEPEEQPSFAREVRVAEPAEVVRVEQVEELREVVPPAAPAPAPEPAPATPRLQSQPALVFAAGGELPVFATTLAPGGVYVERVRQRNYWVPGAASASAAVTRAIERARAETPSRGATVVIADVGEATVVMTDVAPVAGTHSEAAGERRAWIAGVATPNAAQRAALAAAIEAEARAQ